MAKRLAKTSYKQYEELLTFIEKNRIVITGKTRPLEAKKILNLWNEFAVYINSLGYGPQKTAEQWRHVFNEWKTNTRRKSRQIYLCMSGTGGGPPLNKKLTELEERLLSLISNLHLGDSEIIETLVGESDETGVNDILKDDAHVNVVDHDYNQKENSIVSTEDHCTLSDLLEPTASTSKKYVKNCLSPRDDSHTQRAKTSKTKRNILCEATKSYENAQKIKVELEKAKAESIAKLSNSFDKYTDVYEAQTRAKLKLEYYKIFSTFDDFENLYK